MEQMLKPSWRRKYMYTSPLPSSQIWVKNYSTVLQYYMPTSATYCLQIEANIIEIDNDERGVIGDFTTISDIRITKAKPE